MKPCRHIWCYASVFISGYLASWYVWSTGFPFIWLDHWIVQLGLRSSHGEVLDPLWFWSLSRRFMIVNNILVIGNIVWIFWMTTQNRTRRILLIFIVTFVIAQGVLGTMAIFYPEYGCFEVLYGGTVYSPKFTKKGFAQIQPGISKKEVEALIGSGFPEAWMSPPSSIVYEDPIWMYSKPDGHAGNHWKYWVYFEGDVVSRKEMIFWTD